MLFISEHFKNYYRAKKYFPINRKQVIKTKLYVSFDIPLNAEYGFPSLYHRYAL